MKHVAIVGGGVIGLCSAYALRHRGYRVTIVDAAEAGAACSTGNAGWIVPSLSAPIPAPGLVGTTLKWMLHGDSPLYIKPRASPAFVGWLLHFWRACNAQSHQAGLSAVGALNEHTMRLYDELRAQGVEFEMHQQGLLMAYLSSARIESDRAGMRTLKPLGYDVAEPLDGDSLRKLEPALSDAVAGGYWISQERHVQPMSLMRGLIDYLKEHDVSIRENTPVLGIERDGARVSALLTAQGRIEADDILIAAGSWTPRILRKVGFRLPIEGGKGYSMDFETPAEPGQVLPRHALYLRESKVGVSPYNGTLRLAGTMELSGINLDVAPRRVDAMLRAARAYLRHIPASLSGQNDASIRAKAWVGLRPLAPDGLPVLGLVPGFKNLSVATGHAMLGVTLGPATGESMADLIATGQIPDLLRPFDPARFAKTQA